MLRHAKAEAWGESDHERELTTAGIADAAAAGTWLARAVPEPGQVLVSSARRTRQTWESVATSAGWTIEATVDDGLYSAEPETMLDLMRATADEVQTLLVIGHNPTIAYLAQMLDDGNGDEEASAALLGGYPTCALTVFDHDGPWADLTMGAAAVRAFHVGRA